VSVKVYIVKTKKETAKPCEEVYLMCTRAIGKLMTAGGTTPPLARKLPQRFSGFYLPRLGGFFTQIDSRHNTITNSVRINIGRHNTLYRKKMLPDPGEVITSSKG
jgi:hypothetical protein